MLSKKTKDKSTRLKRHQVRSPFIDDEESLEVEGAEGGGSDVIHCCAGRRKQLAYYLVCGCLWKPNYKYLEVIEAMFEVAKLNSPHLYKNYFNKHSREQFLDLL